MIRLYFEEIPLVAVARWGKWSHWRPGPAKCEKTKAWTKAKLRGGWTWREGWGEGELGFSRVSSEASGWTDATSQIRGSGLKSHFEQEEWGRLISRFGAC